MKKMRLGIHVFLLATFLVVITAGLSFGEQFNWRKYEGTTLRALFSKSAFSKITMKQLAQFEKETGIKVNAEWLPSAPLRQKLVMELGAKNTDLDLYEGMMKTGRVKGRTQAA